MEEKVILDDRTKLAIYGSLYLLLTFLLIFIAFIAYGAHIYLITFFAITGVWFTSKYAFGYLRKAIKNKPVCVFTKDEIISYTITDKEKKLAYKDTTEVQILENNRMLQLLLKGKGVDHPSGAYYVGIVYPFKKDQLASTKETIIEELKKHHVKYDIQKKK